MDPEWLLAVLSLPSSSQVTKRIVGSSIFGQTQISCLGFWIMTSPQLEDIAIRTGFHTSRSTISKYIIYVSMGWIPRCKITRTQRCIIYIYIWYIYIYTHTHPSIFIGWIPQKHIIYIYTHTYIYILIYIYIHTHIYIYRNTHIHTRSSVLYLLIESLDIYICTYNHI